MMVQDIAAPKIASRPEFAKVIHEFATKVDQSVKVSWLPVTCAFVVSVKFVSLVAGTSVVTNGVVTFSKLSTYVLFCTLINIWRYNQRVTHCLAIMKATMTSHLFRHIT